MSDRITINWHKSLVSLAISLVFWESSSSLLKAAPPREPDLTVECELLVVGGGLAGVAASYEALLLGKTVCLTEITDWVGGQLSSQGTSALDERTTQREQLFYPQGYLELRERIENYYGELNPGECWVSESCFLPKDGHTIIKQQLDDAAAKGNGTLKWFPSTVIKELEIEQVGGGTGQQITSAVAIQHSPVPNTPPLNTEPLSHIIEDAYSYRLSSRLRKEIIRFVPPENSNLDRVADWYVIEATETGEIVALADVPYRLGVDPLSHLEPSSSSETGNPYCTQGFTYTFAMDATEEPQSHVMPPFYPNHSPYYSYELERLADFDLVFTYRRIWSPTQGDSTNFNGISFSEPTPGDISMQNWTWGNDYRPGTSKDNLVYTREQLEATGQLEPGGWLGGLRTETLRKAEDHSLGYFYWLVEGTTDSLLGEDVKKPHPNHRLLTGLDSPMGTVHGLSKYPYIREGRRIIGRPYGGYQEGFSITEVDISRRDYHDEYYRNTLSPVMYRQLLAFIGGVEAVTNANKANFNLEEIRSRSRSTIYPDSVGIGHYAIDFHPCMEEHPPEKPGNREMPGERRGAGQAYPFQIPLRAMIPQKIDNLLVAGKSIATSHIAAAAYRVHSFEWSSGAAAGITAVFALNEELLPYQLVDEYFFNEEELPLLKEKLEATGNPTAFPDTSIFNQSWDDWR